MKIWIAILCSSVQAVTLAAPSYAADPTSDPPDESGIQSYLIPTDRPEKVGNKHHIEGHATIKVDSFAMADGKTYKETSETGSFDLVGTLTVVAVASNGGPSAVDILIDKCEMTSNGSPSTIVQRGDRLTMVKQAAASNGIVRLNNIELEKKTAFLITSFLPLNEPDRTEHAGPLYGLDIRRKVGERWDINPAMFTRYMKTYNPAAKDGDYSGTAEFSGITRTNGVEWADVRLDMTSVSPPPEKGPWKITGFRAKTVMSLAIPLGDKPRKQSGEINRTQTTWMGNDYNNHGVLQHLIFNTVSKYRAIYSLTPLDADKAESKN